MAATPSIKVIKSMPWRGTTRQVSNRYHFNGGTPADNAHWTTLSDAIVAAEKAVIWNGSGMQIVETIGYAAGSDVPVFSKAYAVAGTFADVNLHAAPGEVAALVRYATAARTGKNHPVYLFNYYHGVGHKDGDPADTLIATMRTAFETYASAWIAGFSDGANTLVRSGPNGATAVSRVCEQFLTHRDFPRG